MNSRIAAVFPAPPPVDFGRAKPRIESSLNAGRVRSRRLHMSNGPTDKPAVNAEALAGALRALGMLYGASQPLAAIIAGAKTEAEAIRMYIERERPHLLASYDLETLVKMVQGAREAKTDAKHGVEQFSPSDKPPAKRRS